MFGSFEITSIRLYTPLRNPNKNCDQSLINCVTFCRYYNTHSDLRIYVVRIVSPFCLCFFFLCGLYTKVSSTEVMWYLYPKQTLENTERQAKMNNPEKLAIFGTKNTAQYKIRYYVVSDAVSKKNNTFRNYMYLESRLICAGNI